MYSRNFYHEPVQIPGLGDTKGTTEEFRTKNSQDQIYISGSKLWEWIWVGRDGRKEDGAGCFHTDVLVQQYRIWGRVALVGRTGRSKVQTWCMVKRNMNNGFPIDCVCTVLYKDINNGFPIDCVCAPCSIGLGCGVGCKLSKASQKQILFLGPDKW